VYQSWVLFASAHRGRNATSMVLELPVRPPQDEPLTPASIAERRHNPYLRALEVGEEIVVNISPSDLPYLWEECKQCFYLKSVHRIYQPSIFPSIFGKIDQAERRYFHGRRSYALCEQLPLGVLDCEEKKLTSVPIEVPGHTARCRIVGKHDCLIRFVEPELGAGVVDFKCMAPDDRRVPLLARQLHAYAFALERPASGFLQAFPVTRLGLYCVEPRHVWGISTATSEGLVLGITPTWIDVPRDDKGFLSLLREILDVVLLSEPPSAGSGCQYCRYRECVRRVAA
jgi:hypothetical protein